MKDIIMFEQLSCPYCRMAHSLINELKNENKEYENIEIKFIDEIANYELADSFDYYFVPTFYIDNKKIHEGKVNKDIVKKILDLSLEKSLQK